jgi:selenide,water dikinase
MDSKFRSIQKDLVLVGGGHTHTIALRMFGMKPMPGVRLTLITDASDTPYSGMLPGHVAGFYTHAECHIDLRPLAQFAGAQLYIDRAVGLDLENQRVICATRPPVAFDLLSIDIGSTPKMPNLNGDLDAIIPAKPVAQLLKKWDQVVQQVAQAPTSPICLGIVGGGAGGVELALNMQHRLQEILQAANQPLANLTIHLLQRDAELLPNHNRWVRQHFHKLMAQRGIQLHLQEEVEAIKHHHLHCKSGLTIQCDFIFWVTQASAPDWLGKAGLAVDQDGFVLVDDGLRSSHAQVFAAGDIATMSHHPRPKAGVFAVRQGKPLFQNLRQALQGKPPKPFHPQKQYLSLIGTGNGAAVASRGAFGFQSPLLWQWKDHIDRAFMKKFSQLPAMMAEGSGQAAKGEEEDTETRRRGDLENASIQTSNLKPQNSALNLPHAQRLTLNFPFHPLIPCAGCGAKVGNTTLERVLRRIQQPLSPISSSSILIGLDAPDDAAVIQVPAGMVMVQTIDYFPALINDPFVFGQITTHHALNDLYAMGAQPQSALAIATLPYAQPANLEETLYQLLSGALSVLHQANAALIGGHTIAGPDLMFGLSCNGLADPDRLLRKGGMQPGQVLILTKAIGTGALFAAHMRLQAKGCWIDRAVASMCISNQQAALCFLHHQASACTDVTGFGLVGHLLEMIRASNVSVTLNLDAIPWLDGALETVQMEIVSSLYPQNAQAVQFIENAAEVNDRPQFPLLFDPQTSGGLLATVPASEGDRCLAALQQLGYSNSAIIGKTIPLTNFAQPITIAAGSK